VTKPALIILIVSTAIFFPLVASAESRVERAGIVNSPKGFGISMGIQQSDRQIYNTLNLVADLEGILDGSEDTPGIKFSYIHENILKAGTIRDDVGYKLFFGGGFSAGFVKDHGPSVRNHGAMLGMAAAAGVIFIFPGSIDIALSFTGEFGLHLRTDEKYGNLDLAWYENGVIKAPIPQITLYYRF